MRVLIVHNRYRHHGGEDAVVDSDVDLLRRFGCEVRLYERGNSEFETSGIGGKLKVSAEMAWSKRSYDDMRWLITEFHPDIVHCHNIFYRATPSVYDACRAENVPIVQSLHNFRPFCCNGLFLRDGQICELCQSGNFWHGVRYRCLQSSFLRSSLVSLALARCRQRNVWHKVNRFVVASEFTKEKYIESGFPEEKISIKPHFVDIPQEPQVQREGYMLFVGRLSEEKGLNVLLKACRLLKDVSIRIVGSGPLEQNIRETISRNDLDQVALSGFLESADFERVFRSARFLVLPSLCYENFPRVVAEAYSSGLPIVASRLGSMQELIRDGETGFLFNPRDANDLALKVREMVDHPDLLGEMQINARQEYLNRYTPEINFARLMDIYQQTIKESL